VGVGVGSISEANTVKKSTICKIFCPIFTISLSVYSIPLLLLMILLRYLTLADNVVAALRVCGSQRLGRAVNLQIRTKFRAGIHRQSRQTARCTLAFFDDLL